MRSYANRARKSQFDRPYPLGGIASAVVSTPKISRHPCGRIERPLGGVGGTFGCCGSSVPERPIVAERTCALADAAYLEHVGLTTPVREDKNADEIRNMMAKKWNTNEVAEHWDELKKTFAECMLDEDLRYCVVPEQFEGQRFLRSSFRSKWVREAAQ